MAAAHPRQCNGSNHGYWTPIVGLPTTKRPYISKVKKGASFDHSAAGDPIGTAAKCKVRFGFLNFPIVHPQQSP